MRSLLGAGGLLKICRCRVRWYSKDKTFLPPKELYEKARKGLEAKARKLTHCARLRPGDGKKPETPALETLCRALASSSSSSGGKEPTSSIDPSLGNKSPSIPLIAHENIKQEPQNQLQVQGKLTIERSGTPELFNCKTCQGDGEAGEDREVSGLKLVNCKISGGDGSILKKEPECAELSKALPKEKPQDLSKPTTGIINQPPVKVESSKLLVKASVAKPQEKPLEKPQEKAAVKANAPKKKPKAANPESDKPPKSPTDRFTMPLSSAFPSGRNPCRDGKRDGEKCEAPIPKTCAQLKLKPRPCAKEEKELEEKCEEEEDCPPTKPKKQKDKPCADPSKAASKPQKKPEAKEKKDKPPVKKVEPPKAEAQSKPQDKPSKEKKEMPKSPPVKQASPPKAATQSTKPQKWVQPPLPTNSWTFPITSAFPLGRNPCRDGPRGGVEDDCELEPECEPVCEEKIECEEEEEPIEETCMSWKKESEESYLDEKPCKLKELKEKDPPPKKEEKPKTKPKAAEEIPCHRSCQPESGDCTVAFPRPPVPAGSTGLPLSDSPPEKTKREPAEDKSDAKKEALEASKKAVAKAENARPAEEPEPPKKRERRRSKSTEESKSSPELKQFPVAPLQVSLRAYLASIEPLLTAKEFQREKKLTEDFEENEGQDLHEMLEAVAEKCTNWLTPRWTQAAFLAYQAPLTVFSSPGLAFPVQKFTTPLECLNFTAKAIHGTYEFKELVDQNKIPVVKMGNTDLDNSQFGKIFGTVRKPGRLCDSLKQHNKAQYVVVAYKYNFFKLPICSSSGKLLSVTSIRDELEAIVNCPLERGEPFGLLTHDNRGNWAEAYLALSCPRGNADSMEAIEQSLFVVCLDDCVPVPKGQESIVQAYQLLHGGGLKQNSANRWMDKCIQLIVNPNGLAGFCYEHSPADCQPLAMLMDYILDKVNDTESDCEETNKEENTNPATLLKFRPRDDCINLWLHAAMRNIQKISSLLRMNVFRYECHGKCFIKAQGLNPDSYIQMALQLAYYNMHGTLPAQYEAAHLRIFVEGRTETIRSTSNESKDFVLAMNSEKASTADKLAALQRAVDAHERLTRLALYGKGIDRYLFGLQQMAIENSRPVPKFFKSKGFVKSVTFQLFTSQVATAHDSFMAYGPLTCDGYGCCYNPHKDKIIFALSAWQTSPKISPEHYGKAIKRSLDSMRKLILLTGGDRVGEHPCHCKNIPT